MKIDIHSEESYLNNKKQIFNKIVTEIENSISLNKNSIYLENIVILDDIVNVTADRSDWLECLDKALTFYKQLEEFFACDYS